MRITYIVHARFPAEKAYGLQIAAVCSALADLGHDVTIVAPFTKNYILFYDEDYPGVLTKCHILSSLSIRGYHPLWHRFPADFGLGS